MNEEYQRKTDAEIIEIKSLLKTHIEHENNEIVGLKEHVAEVVRSTVQEKVNGKIDKIHSILEKQNEASEAFHAKVDARMKVVEPYITGLEGGKSIGKVIMWAGGIIGALAVIRASLMSLIK